jgi:hypothetical protein
MEYKSYAQLSSARHGRKIHSVEVICDDSLISHALTYNKVEKEDRKSKIENEEECIERGSVTSFTVKSPREVGKDHADMADRVVGHVVNRYKVGSFSKGDQVH